MNSKQQTYAWALVMAMVFNLLKYFTLFTLGFVDSLTPIERLAMVGVTVLFDWSLWAILMWVREKTLPKDGSI